MPVEIGRVRVLLIESDVGDEWRYPFDALRAYPGIAPAFLPADRARDELPDSAAALAACYEVVVIGDTGTGAAAFRPAQLDALAKFVRAGGGFMMVGGAKCYTPGGYAETPLAAILPVDLADGSYRLGPVQVEVTAPEVVLFEHYEPAVPTFGAHQVLAAKPGARVLARFEDGTPYLTTGEVERGRVIALGAIWNHGSGQAFRQWRQYGTLLGRMVRWLGRDLK